ncbi:dispanin subfamily A member 2b-like [Protopterus annectens]|uniref:dispanin subfamily A member 2b-like n=1 Tax=Protopterus annectens TaxID=7888 RepID=UPI001CFC19BA|nr:dispanin subfamily A member 2b-like [Protopterus annectens]
MSNKGDSYNEEIQYPMKEYELLKDVSSTQNADTTVVNMESSTPPPKDHLVWSIFNMIYMNLCCLGCIALIFSVKSRDSKVLGDMEEARHYSRVSKILNITTVFLYILSAVMIAVFFKKIFSLLLFLLQL